MIRISIPWIMDTIKTIDAIDNISAEMNAHEKISILFSVQLRIGHLYINSFYKEYLKSSFGQANDLYAIIESILKNEEKLEDPINLFAMNRIQEKKREFMTTLISEFGVLPTYLATPKEAYDVDKVINDGSILFPPSIIKKVPAAELDLKEAGKALAFELSSACGFHIFRAVECVLRRYWEHVTKGDEIPVPATIGSISSELERRNLGNRKVTESLKQLTKLHRNPLIHPENFLTTEEAISIIGISRSAVSAMLIEIPDVDSEQAT